MIHCGLILVNVKGDLEFHVDGFVYPQPNALLAVGFSVRLVGPHTLPAWNSVVSPDLDLGIVWLWMISCNSLSWGSTISRACW